MIDVPQRLQFPTHVKITRTNRIAPRNAGPGNTASPPPLSGGNTGNSGSCSCSSPYTVKPGDGMYAIAQRCGGGLTVASISAANGITNPELIQAGQQLVLPGCGGGSTGESFHMTMRAQARVPGCRALVSAQLPVWQPRRRQVHLPQSRRCSEQDQSSPHTMAACSLKGQGARLD